MKHENSEFLKLVGEHDAIWNDRSISLKERVRKCQAIHEKMSVPLTQQGSKSGAGVEQPVTVEEEWATIEDAGCDTVSICRASDSNYYIYSALPRNIAFEITAEHNAALARLSAVKQPKIESGNEIGEDRRT